MTKYLVLELFSSSRFTRQLIPHQYLLDKFGAGAALRSVQEIYTKFAVPNISRGGYFQSTSSAQTLPW
jgi:hypothetical protein